MSNETTPLIRPSAPALLAQWVRRLADSLASSPSSDRFVIAIWICLFGIVLLSSLSIRLAYGIGAWI